MTDMTHERCSELLGAYASGGLDERGRRQVDEHLATCSDCSLELAAVQTLQASDVLPLSGAERDQLSRSVRAAVLPGPRRGLLERLGPRLAPALGAVALIAVAAVAIISMPDRSVPSITSADQSGGGDTADAQTQGTAEEAETMEAEAPQPAGAPARQDDGDPSGDGGSGVAEGGAAGSADAVSGRASSLNARSNFVVHENDFARTGLELGSLVPALSPRRGSNAYAVDPGDLAALAPDDRVAGLVEGCAERTLSTSPHPLVPTSAAYYPDGVLVIGFVWREGSVLNYELRGWPDGDCARISPIYRRGVLE